MGNYEKCGIKKKAVGGRRKAVGEEKKRRWGEKEIVAKRRFRDSGKGRMGEPKNGGKGDWGKEQFERRRRLKI